MILLVHPFGNANVRAVLAALDGADRLGKFLTTLGWSNSSPILQALPEKLDEQPPLPVPAACPLTLDDLLGV